MKLTPLAKSEIFKSDDPDFNYRAAQKAFDLVMKMDDDTAEMFVTLCVTEMLDDTIEKNLPLLQRHLNEVIEKRLTRVKKALVRKAATYKGDDAVPFAQALTLIEKAKNPYDHGYVWRESDFNRDPSTGRFRLKVSHTQKKPLDDKTSEVILGTVAPKQYKSKTLTPEQRAQFQDEYRQLAQFLSAVNASTGQSGDADIVLHFQDKAGNRFAQKHNSGVPPEDDLANPSLKLIGAEARPTTLTYGGAAFGLSGALGRPMEPATVRGINRVFEGVDAGGAKFRDDWLSAGEGQEKNSNAKLYGRVASGSEFIGALAPPGSKLQMAAKFGHLVGSHGPEAEAVLGPTARKTAYRYRGTEMTPDNQLVSEYGRAINRTVSRGEFDQDRRSAMRGAQTRAINAALQAKAEAHNKGKPREKQIDANAMRLTDAERIKILNEVQAKYAKDPRSSTPSWEDREAGREIIQTYLRKRGPERRGSHQLYNLQLAAGHTPPSEGVILNADGQIAAQAVGYGDDHYLPFNLKNLKALKGGEYIRTRSVGGPTTEDIYTGLVSGARRVTVVSRSGTFSVEFKEDFRGGRRHNDKARRMTRRYAELLDAVQSQQVDRMDVDADTRRAITEEVKEEFGNIATPAEIRAEVTNRIEEFKSNPEITDENLALVERQVRFHTSSSDTQAEIERVREDLLNNLAEQKEYKFRLNGAGYTGALEALREQFPYYIQVKSNPTRDPERHEPRIDRGYVEPGRNRPTAAQAGLFGTGANPGYGKFSASQADYQGGGGKRGRVVPVDNSAAASTVPAKTEVKNKIAEAKQVNAYSDVALAVQAEIRSKNPEMNPEDQMLLSLTREQLKDPANQKKFDDFANFAIGKGIVSPELGVKYQRAAGHFGQEPYSDDKAGLWGPKPFAFADPAYQPGADLATRRKELSKLDTQLRGGLVHDKPASAMSDEELRQEHDLLVPVRAQMEAAGAMGLNLRDKADALPGVDKNSPALRGLLDSPQNVTARMKALHQMRTLQADVPADQRVAVHEEKSLPADGDMIIRNQHDPEASRKLAEDVDKYKYWAEHAAVAYPEDSVERNLALQFLHDMNENPPDNAEQFHQTLQANEGISNVIMRAMHDNKIPNYQPEKKEKRGNSGGSILR